MRLVDRVSSSDTRIVVMDRVSRSETRIVVVDRVSRSDTRIVVEDRSVTFRHKKNKESESWIMIIYSGLKNLIPKWVWCGGLSPHRCAWVVSNGYGTCCCHLLSIWLVLCYYSIYIAFYFELADDTYSVRVPCTDPYLYSFSLLFMECNKRAINFDSSATLASLHHTRIQGELLFLAWTGSSSSRLYALKFWHGLDVYLF